MNALAECRAIAARAAERALLLATLATHRGNRTATAATLGISAHQVHVRISALALTDELDALARRHGWYDDATPSGVNLRARRRAR